jgi:hypothetical protein
MKKHLSRFSTIIIMIDCARFDNRMEEGLPEAITFRIRMKIISIVDSDSRKIE